MMDEQREDSGEDSKVDLKKMPKGRNNLLKPIGNENSTDQGVDAERTKAGGLGLKDTIVGAVKEKMEEAFKTHQDLMKEENKRTKN